MDKIYNFEQYQGLNLDYSLIVNSTLDIKHGSILCINNEDADKPVSYTHLRAHET